MARRKMSIDVEDVITLLVASSGYIENSGRYCGCNPEKEYACFNCGLFDVVKRLDKRGKFGFTKTLLEKMSKDEYV